MRNDICPDVKANKKQQEIKIWWLYCTNFYKKYLENLKHNVKRVCIFHLILVGILSILILSVKNKGVGEGVLYEQNPLSVPKVIGPQCLTPIGNPDKTTLRPWKFHRIVLQPLEIPKPKTKTHENSTRFFLDHP